MTSESSFISTITSLSKNVSLIFVTRIFSACVSIGMLPLFTRYLTPAEYGTIAILDSTVEIFGALFVVGLGRTVVRFFHNTDDDRQRKQIVSTGMIISGTVTVFILVLLVFIYRPVSFLAFKSHEFDNFMLLAISTLLIGIPGGIVSSVLMASARLRVVCIIEIIKVVFVTLLKIYLVVFLERGVDGVLWTNFAAAVIYSLGMTVWIFFSVGISVNRSLIFPMIRYGLPFAPTVLSNIAMNSLNRFYLQAYGSSEQVAYYQMAYQLPFALYIMIVVSFERIWSSHTLFILSQNADASSQYKRISTYFLSLLSFVMFTMAISADVIIKLFAAPEYASAALYIPFIAFGLWLHAFHIFAETGVLLSKDTYLLTIYYGLALGATILFNWLLIPRFGVYGAAYAAVLIYFFSSFIGCLVCKGFGYLNLRKMGSVAVLWITLVLIKYQIGSHSVYMDILCIIFFSVLYLGLMFYLPFCLSKKERDDVLALIKKH